MLEGLKRMRLPVSLILTADRGAREPGCEQCATGRLSGGFRDRFDLGTARGPESGIKAQSVFRLKRTYAV